MMHIEVLTDRIKIGAVEFVPRFLDLPRVLIVNAGETITPLADSTWDYIEIAGTLSISRDFDTVLRFTHLVILPGGHLDCGSEDHPMPRHVEFIVRDVPIDLTRDPFQWGNGLLNFGQREMCGAKKLTWTVATDGLSKGATTVTLRDDPAAWDIGDELLVTETHIVPAALPRGLEPFTRESTVTITAISGRQITFSKPLDADHLPLTDPDDKVVAYPRIGNLTRNLVMRSENPAGTPGHVADVGMGAMWCGCYLEHRGLGRTRNVPLHDVDPVTLAPGTNQRGRYADHKHHAMGFGSISRGLVLVGQSLKIGPKWGHATHNVHDSIVEDCIAVGFSGAGFVTEDGNEVRNAFRRNLAVYNRGTHDGTPGAESSAIKVGNPGVTGNGFFIRGVRNIFEGNEAWNNFIGIDLFTQEIGSFAPLFYPSVPGGEADTLLTLADNLPISFTGNVGNSNAVTGLEFWFVTEFPAHDQQIAFNGQFQFLQGTSNPAAPNFVNVDCVGDRGQTQGIASSLAYAQKMKVTGGRIVGCEIGIPDGGANGSVEFEDVFFQNGLDIDYRDLPQLTRHTNCRHAPLPGRPAHYIQFGRPGVWDGTGTPPPTGTSEWRAQQGSKHYLTNWQGSGKHYQLLTEKQLGSLPAPYSSNPPIAMAFNTPLVGTVEQSWMRLGMAPYGDMVRDVDAAKLDGIPLGYAREGVASVLGPPRFILTSPTPRQPAFVFAQDGSPNKQMRLYGVLTGDGVGISRDALISIDGSTPVLWHPNPGIIGADDFTMTMDAVGEGAHTVTTWRVDLAGKAIEASLMAFPFVVGAIIDPAPPATATVPNVVGMTHASAVSAITAVRLLATSTMQHSATVPAGHILSQAPSAGAVVALGSSVNLIESDGPMPTLPPPPPDGETWTATTITAEKSSKGRVRIIIG